MTSPLVYVHTDVPPEMTLAEWRRARSRPRATRLALRRRLRALVVGLLA